MQIGNRGDPAHGVLLRGGEGSDLIMSSDLVKLLAKTDSIDKPEVNIRAAIAYLFTRMAKYETRSIENPFSGDKPLSYTVAAGDSFSKIAAKVGTTVANLEVHNRNVKPSALRPGMVLSYIPAFMMRFVSGFRAFQTATVADRYNGGGDPEYSAKLSHLLLKVFPRLVR
jgi:hypothetical protein